ncbi:MAG: hypothetical protein ACLU62_06015 [Hydrogeniiclostridium sp.]
MNTKCRVSLPYITSYPEIATVLSIIDTKTSFPWLANWFLQIEAYRHQDGGLLLDYCIPDPFTSCPWILYEKISRAFIKSKWDSVTDFMIDAVNNGQVASFVVDTSRIGLYQNSHGYAGHTIMLYGYDAEKQLFSVGDNFAVSNKAFRFDVCSFAELESAYADVTGFGSRTDWVHGVRLLSPKTQFDHGHGKFSHTYNWAFSKELFAALAGDFLHSRNSTRWFSNPRLNKAFRFDVCSFAELESAYADVTGFGSRTDWVHGVRLLSPKTQFDHGHGKFSHTYNWAFSKELFAALAGDFLHSRNSTRWFSNPRLTYSEGEYYYGLDCISYVIDVLRSLRGEPIDIRGIFLLAEYAGLMEMRVSYLLENGMLPEGGLREKAEKIHEDMRRILMLSLKYNFTEKQSILDSVLFRLERFREALQSLMEELLVGIDGFRL